MLIWYDKYCTVLDSFEKPGLYRNSTLVMAFALLRVAVRYGSLFGIWFVFGIYVACAAWLLGFVFSTLVLRYYYDSRFNNGCLTS